MLEGDQVEASETELQQQEIKREDRISNPMPAFSPQVLPRRDPPNRSQFQDYSKFIQDILPRHMSELVHGKSEALQFMEASIQKDKNSIISSLILHSFLLSCHSRQIDLVSSPSLTKLSFLHHELIQCSEIIHNDAETMQEMHDYCMMMVGDTADMYHSHFSDIAEQKFWGKTKTVQELVSMLLKKEFERLRLLNDHTFNQLSSLAIRKAIDSAPSSAVPELIKYAKQNKISLE